ncbi:MAG: alpha/beta hydrolase fold domain-containing protein [Pyrinomonadaceae bacterium]
MNRKRLLFAAFAIIAGAAVLFAIANWPGGRGRTGFVQRNGARFTVDGRPFRFVGANVAIMYRDEDRARMPETLRHAAQLGIKVVRVWAFGEGGPNDVKPIGADFNDWPRNHSFRSKPGEWNEAEFVFLDQVLAEAARNNPLAAPMLADLAKLPPLYVAACEFDPLRDDSERLADRAKAAGVEIEFRLWKGMVHAAVSLMGWIDAMGPKVDRIGEFLRQVTRAG